MLLRQWIEDFAGCCETSGRQIDKVVHSVMELQAHRMPTIACGYVDANDSARLGANRVHKMLLDRDPVPTLDLADRRSYIRRRWLKDQILLTQYALRARTHLGPVKYYRCFPVSHLPVGQAEVIKICGGSYLWRGSVHLVVDGQFHTHTFIVTTAL